MPACADCGFVGGDEDFPEYTEDDIREHYEAGGFDCPDSALERVGSPYCPDCQSDQIV